MENKMWTFQTKIPGQRSNPQKFARLSSLQAQPHLKVRSRKIPQTGSYAYDKEVNEIRSYPSKPITLNFMQATTRDSAKQIVPDLATQTPSVLLSSYQSNPFSRLKTRSPHS